MTYTFVDISTVKFSVNARELFKTFIPFYVNSTHIKIINIYDSSMVLIPSTHVSEFEVDGVTYANATDLSNAIHDVVFSRTVDGAVNNAQIETNRLAIIDLQNDKADINHNHDTRYYTKTQVDTIISGIEVGSGGVLKGEVDGDVINFRKADDTIVYTIDVETLTAQGTILSFENGVLTLKNDKGVVLSTTSIQANESYYDTFNFSSGLEDDLNDLVLTDPFHLVKTNGDLYFFVSDVDNDQNFEGSRIYINELGLFFDLDTPDISNSNFKAWEIIIPDESFVENEFYNFNYWFNLDDSTDIIKSGKKLFLADWNNNIGAGRKGYKFIRPTFDWENIPESHAHSIWIIREYYDLNGATVNFPDNVTLKFEGGVIRNAELVGNNTEIDSSIDEIFKTDVSFSGTWKNNIFFIEWFGGKGNGIYDNILSMTTAHQLGRVAYSNGTYLFTGQNLNLTKGCIVRESEDGVIFTNGLYNGIISFDRSGNLIGLHHNHLEEKSTSGTTPQITSGNIVAPPKLSTVPTFPIDFIATWYNDFGLDSTRSDSEGWNGWYSWEWAHTDASVNLGATPKERGYQAKRHPLLGWYRGDDQNVLDWQCYWLAEAGVKACIVQPRGSGAKLDAVNWHLTSNLNNWIYKLFYTVPNASNLGFIIWGDSSINTGGTTEQNNLIDSWENNIQVTHDAGKAYVTNYLGKNYITLYIFEGEYIRGLFDNYSGSTNTVGFFEGIADFCKTLGYDGVCVLARHETGNAIMNRGELLNKGVLYIASDYVSTSKNDNAPYTSYQDLVDDFIHDDDDFGKIVTVPLDLESSVHPSDYAASGSTVAIFKELLKKAIDTVYKDRFAPNIISLYNVSEWAESGVGLMPTIGNGYLYLDAIKESMNNNKRLGQIKNITENYYKPTSTINFKGGRISISSDYTETFTFTPTLRDGIYESEEIEIFHSNNANNGSDIVLSDNSVTAGTKLYFKADANKTIKPKRSIKMKWNSFLDGWEEI